jgi:hypothetical protein
MTDAERIAKEWHRVHQRMSAYHCDPPGPGTAWEALTTDDRALLVATAQHLLDTAVLHLGRDLDSLYPS